LALELSETLTHTTFIVLKFLTSTPNLPSQSSSRVRENLGDIAERNTKNPRTRTYTTFILV